MKNTIITLLILTLFVSCGNRGGLEFLDSQNLDLQQEELITFEDLKNRIITPHCINCHKRSGTEDGIKNWVIAGDPENSKLFKVIKDGRMPKNSDPLPSSELEFVRLYIMDMAKTRVLETVDFNTLKNEILAPHCLSCHKRMDNEESLMRWVNVTDPMSSRLLGVVKEGKMPKNAAPLSINEQNMIIKYLNNFLSKENQ